MSQINGLLDKVQKLHDAVESRAGTGVGSSNVNNIKLDMGGVGVWACLTACLISMFMCVFMAVMFLDMNRKYDRTQDLLSVIYQQAPWLKPPPDKKE